MVNEDGCYLAGGASLNSFASYFCAKLVLKILIKIRFYVEIYA